MSDCRVHVLRNPLWRTDDKGRPWFVTCDYCAGDGARFGVGLFGAALSIAFGGPGCVGWAPTWETAQYHAHRHALRHEQTRCPTCLHVPSEPIPTEAKA